MFCFNCGTQLDDDAQFCSNCGSPMGQGAEVSAQHEANNAQDEQAISSFVGMWVLAGANYAGEYRAASEVDMNMSITFSANGRTAYVIRAEDSLETATGDWVPNAVNTVVVRWDEGGTVEVFEYDPSSRYLCCATTDNGNPCTMFLSLL